MMTPLGPLTPEMPVNPTGLSRRALRAIRRVFQWDRGVRVVDLSQVSLAAVASLTSEDLLAMQGCGRTTLKEIEDKLAEAGLALADRTPPPGAPRLPPPCPEVPARPRLNDQLLWLAAQLGVDAGEHATDTGLAVAVWQRVREDLELAQKYREGQAGGGEAS